MKKLPLSFFIVLSLGFIFRILSIDRNFYFFMDEALLAFRGWGIFGLGKFFLIGGISPLGFHLPPYFYWFSALFLPILNFDPVIWGYAAALISCLTMYCLYIWVRKISNSRIALITLLIYAFSFTAIFFDRHFWPLVLNPLFTIILLYLLPATHKFKWIFISLLLVFAITCDPTNIILLILTFFYLFFEKETLDKSKIVAALIFIFLFFGPLIIFDLRHDGSNISGISRLISSTKNSPRSLNSISQALLLPFQTLSRFWYSPQTNIAEVHTYCTDYALMRTSGQPTFLVIIAGFVLFFFFTGKIKSENRQDRLLAYLLIIYFGGLLFYGFYVGRSLFDHYLAGLLPVFALVTAKFFARFWVVGFFFLVTFLCLNLVQFAKAQNSYGLEDGKKAVDWTIGKLGDDRFALDSLSGCFRYSGIRYLFEIKKFSPDLSFIDKDFFWLYKDLPKNSFPDKVVVFSDSQKDFTQPILASDVFGSWRVYILDNSMKTYRISEE